MTVYKEHLNDEVETEELAAQYAYKSPNIATVELIGKIGKTKLGGE